MKIGIWGYGLEGRAAHRYFARRDEVDIVIIDDLPIEKPEPGLPLTDVLVGRAGRAEMLKRGLDLIVRSPGVSIYEPEFAILVAAQKQVTTGTNLWFENYQQDKIIVVTGTKGKSTTSTFLLHILQSVNLDARLLGNVGTPLLNQQPGQDVTVVELSSYQIADLQFSPDIAVITNLYPEHLQWHRGEKNYFADKLRIGDINLATEMFLQTNDVISNRHFAHRIHTHRFSSDHLCKVKGEKADYDYRGTRIRQFLSKGLHNLDNLAAALAVAQFAYPDRVFTEIDFSNFKALPHRLTEHTLGNGLICVDDSISTIPESVIAALEVYSGGNVQLFLGGYDRGLNYAILLEKLLRKQLKAVYLFGPVGLRLSSDMNIPKSRVFPTLRDALASAGSNVKAKDVLLLSPGAPSFDEFSSFKARGDFFIDHCRRYAPG